MFNWRKLVRSLVVALVGGASLFVTCSSLAQSQKQISASTLAGLGRGATPAEVAAWDIDVRPDFKGLPKGSGSVAQGEKIWDGKCASCHGTFAESNQVFFTLMGYTTKQDVETGRVTSLQLTSDVPYRSMMMKLSTVSTLWDYINRAMPWTAPKSLKPDEVYAVTAFLLNLGNVIPDDFVLSDKNIAQVQKRTPNRNGMTLKHSMWPGAQLSGINGLTAKPDTQGSSCMKNCANLPKVASSIPAYAMTAHGNLAEQNRLVGGVVGLDTSDPVVTTRHIGHEVPAPPAVHTASAANAKTAKISAAEVMPLLQKNTCTACHAVSGKLLGPSFEEVAKKYAGRTDVAAYLASKIKSGGVGLWGGILMPPMSVSEDDLQKISQWLAQGAVE